MSKKVIPKRIYVILDNVILSKEFFENGYLKHCKRYKEIKIIPEKEFSGFILSRSVPHLRNVIQHKKNSCLN